MTDKVITAHVNILYCTESTVLRVLYCHEVGAVAHGYKAGFLRATALVASGVLQKRDTKSQVRIHWL